MDDFIVLSISSVTLMSTSNWTDCGRFRCSVIVQDVASGSVAPVLSLGEPMTCQIHEYIDADAQQSMGVTPERRVVEFTSSLDARMIDLHRRLPWMLQVDVDLCVVLVLDDLLETLELVPVTASRVILKFTKKSDTDHGIVEYDGGTPSVRELLEAFARLRQY